MEKVKTINSELSYKLYNLGVFKNFETKYSICDVGDGPEEPTLTSSIPSDFHEWATSINTLTHDEMSNFTAHLGIWDLYANLIITYAYRYGIEDNIELHEKILSDIIEKNPNLLTEK